LHALQIVACIADRCMHCRSLHALQIVACIAGRGGCHAMMQRCNHLMMVFSA
jgi:hypothetical protein